MSISGKYIEINHHCNEIISELIALNHYVTYEKVYSILLQRYNSNSFDELLGLSNASIECIPTLAILCEICKKLNYFLDSYFSTRSIISFKDLTFECRHFLKSFNLPSFDSSLFTIHEEKNNVAIGCKDPLEIDILESDNQNNTSLQHTTIRVLDFDVFGLGSILKHPKLVNMVVMLYGYNNTITSCLESSSSSVVTNIHVPTNGNTANIDNHESLSSFPLSLHEIHDLLLDYMHQIKWQQHVLFNKEGFLKYACHKYNVGDLIEKGIIIIGDLTLEINALQHSLNTRFKLFVELTRKELLNYHTQVDEISNNSLFPNYSKRIKRNNGSLSDTTYDMMPISVLPQQEQSEFLPQQTHQLPQHHQNQDQQECLCCRHEYDDKLYFDRSLSFTTKSSQTSLSSDQMNLTSSDFLIIDNGQLKDCFPVSLSVITAAMKMTAPPSSSSSSSETNQQEANKLIGRWGEQLVYQYLLLNRSPDTCVKWLNQDEESRACYDFIIEKDVKNSKYDTTYIEVKSTRFNDRNVFEISLWEWRFASSESQVPYHIYRVYNAGDPLKAKIVIVKDVLRLVNEGKIKLCLAI